MNFKVGQRVRIRSDLPLCPEAAERWGHLRGHETRLLERTPFMDSPKWPRFWRIDLRGKYGEPVYVSELGIVPLIGPEETEWAQGKVTKLLKDVKNPIPLEL